MFCLPSDIVSSIFSSLSPLQASPLSLASSSGRRPRTHHLLSVLIVLTGYCQLIDAICDEHQWWQQQLNKCIPCTVCDASQSIVLRPCQLHSDTVCGTLDDIEFDLNILRAAAAVAVEEERIGESQRLGVIEKSTMIMWNWQTLSLVLAGTMCLLFLITVICIYWQHSRYWKKLETMEKGYTADAEELSSRLMHTIIDIRNDDNGRVVLEEAKRDRVNPFDLQCIYFEDLLNNESSSLVPKPLIKCSPKKDIMKSSYAQQPIVQPESITVKENTSIEDDSRQKQGRGNCYTEPMHLNCVTSELYLIT